MHEPYTSMQELMMRVHDVVTRAFWEAFGELAYLWLELAVATFALAAFVWVVSR